MLDRVLRPSPLVLLLDGHARTLAFLATVHDVPVNCLTVSLVGLVQQLGWPAVHPPAWTA